MIASPAARPARAGLLRVMPVMLAVALAFLAAGGPALPELFLGRTRLVDHLAPQTVFVENLGQVEGPAAFYARSGSATFFFAPGAVTASLDNGANGTGDAVRITLEGADSNAPILSLGRTPGIVNVFIGNDPGNWKAGVATHAGVMYSQPWPGIDVRYVGTDGQVESVYTLAPGADPALIRLRYEGAERLYIDGRGELVAQTPLGKLIESAPAAYQQTSGKRTHVEGRYMLLDPNTVGFWIGEYDRALPLVIDPSFVYSTFLGGGGADQGNAIAIDGSGNAYVTGFTASTNFPTVPGSYQTTNGGGRDAFVTKLSPTGSLIYSTYIGGSGLDEGNGIDLDGSGNAYITGVTASTNFPMVSAFQSVAAGVDDVFVAKLNATGSALVYSTYLGGSNDDEGFGIAVDASNNAYVTGTTISSNFNVLNAFQPALALDLDGFSTKDAFVTKLSSTGSALVYSTFLGGGGADQGNAIAVDGAGGAYVTGATLSTNFPTANAFRPTSGGGRDGFVSKFSAAGTTLSYSTYLGGSGSDYGTGITVDGTGNAYVAGLTASTNFPTANAIQPANAGGDDAFITKLNAAGSAATYSTYLGGSGGDGASAISLDTDSSPVITGSTFSTNFPTAGAMQGAAGGGSDAFVAKLTGTGSSLPFSTYLGGSTGGDRGWGVAISGSSEIYVTGSTFSTNFPTANALQAANAGLGDAFVTRITLVGGVGGIAKPPAIGARAAGSEESAGRSSPVALVIVAGAAVALVLVCSAWYARRRLF